MKRIHKNLRKVLAIVLVCAMLVMSMGAYSGEVAYAEENAVYSRTTTQAERDIIHNQQLEEILNTVNTRGVPEYKYEYYYLDYEYPMAEGFAGNQNIAGYKFHSLPAGFFHSFGGRKIDTDVSVSVGLNAYIFSVAIDIGNMSGTATTGGFIGVPNTTDYFKLYVERVMQVRPTVIYRKPYMAPDYIEYEYWTITYTSAEYTLDMYAKKV